MQLTSEQAKYEKELKEYRDGCAYVEHKTTLQVRFHDLGRKECLEVAHVTNVSFIQANTRAQKKHGSGELLHCSQIGV